MTAGTLILRNVSWFSRPLAKFEFGRIFENFENTSENAS